MTTSELFERWAPPEVVWSRWAKPVLFAEMAAVPEANPESDPLPALTLQPDPGVGVIVELPGATSVRVGLALLESGCRPVPLFNGNRGPILTSASAALINNDPIIIWLYAGAPIIENHPLPPNAPPAFLLDSRRKTAVSLTPGRFDNRWIVFPQDFPSANFLKSQGISQVVLVQENSSQRVQEDLCHVLRRWQEAGITLYSYGLSDATDVQPLTVEKPNNFRALFYTFLALAGLRRNSAGGFGSIIPQPSSSGG